MYSPISARYARYGVITLFSVVLLTLLSIHFIKKLKFNYDFESYFPLHDSDQEYLKKFRKEFENDTDFLFIGIESSNSIFTTDFLSKIKSLTDQVSKLKDVRKVFSITNIKTPVIGPGGIWQVPLVHTENPSSLQEDSIRIFQNKQCVGNIISEDSKSISILILNKQDIKKREGDALLDRIETLLLKYHFHKIHIAGKIKASKVYVDIMRRELILFIIASTVLISFFLFIAYRSLWGVLVPLVTVIISITWTLGIMGALGHDLDLLTSLLPPILFVVAMSDMTHLLSKYLEELRSGREKLDALRIALKEVGLATFITAITTAIGFVTLMNSNIMPIRDFGFYTAIGVFVSYTLAFTFLPAALVLLKKPHISKQHNETLFWHKRLQGVLIWIFRNKLNILNGSVSILLISLFFIAKIQVNSSILDDISERDPLKQSVRFFENNFGGIRPFEMTVTTRDTHLGILDFRMLEQMNKLEDYLTNHYKVRNVISPLTFVKGLSQAMNGGKYDFYRLPGKDAFAKLEKKLKFLSRRKEIKAYMSNDGTKYRISGKMNDIGSLAVGKLNDDLFRFIRDSLDHARFDYRLTGSALLIDKNNTYLARSLMEDLIFSIISVAVVIGLLFKSTRMVILAIIPNLIPLLMIGGIMGIFGIHLKASTSIIFSIAFGIAVDDSIHFLSRFRMEVSEGKHFIYALKRTYISTGKAMVVTSLILISGFATLILSTFQSTFYTGLLISLTLLIAIIADLLLLPVLLILFYKPAK